jgi:ribosomal protein S18 acetylase RimI-like enzyme|tara:strand:+ start:358 stop:819 length:462 start_codon:yes stop_codon:yes gene_type:complete
VVPGIFVREAGQSDVSTLIEYNLSLANETESILLDKDILRLGIEKALELNDCRYLVAELNNKIVGQTMVTSEWSDWRNGVIWWMQSVYVNPDYRKRGVFQSILKHIENLAEKIPEVKALRLYVMDDNQIAQRVYQNLGMNNSNYLVYEKPHKT